MDRQRSLHMHKMLSEVGRTVLLPVDGENRFVFVSTMVRERNISCSIPSKAIIDATKLSRLQLAFTISSKCILNILLDSTDPEFKKMGTAQEFGNP